jgi:NAD(P)-dependent dehydrogenase (short-subunit alcohol dehydrogenase family)
MAPFPDFRLDGRVAIVTGASSGIGHRFAQVLAEQGASVHAAARRAERLEELAATSDRIHAAACDVADDAQLEALVQRAVDDFGRIDVVVNNAGILRDVIFHKMSPEDWLAVIGVHLNGSFFTSRAAAEHFRKQESGAFVHITSTSGLIGNFGQANYSAAKLGITALSKSIALDMKRYNVRSNCIAPFAWSRMTSSIPVNTPEQQARIAKIQQMTPDKNAPVAVFLASDAAKNVSGQVFGTRHNEIYLFSSPRPIRSVHRSEGWTPELVAEHMLPAMEASFMPLDRSGDVFGWDPI